MKNAPLTTYKKRKIMNCFAQDLTATQTSTLNCINRNTINKYFAKFRKVIFEYGNSEINLQNKELGEFELDKSYFGAKRVRGKRGRGATGKTPVFGLKKRDGKVFIQIVRGCSRKELMPII